MPSPGQLSVKINTESDRKERDAAFDKFIDTNPKKISWSAALRVDFARNNRLDFDYTALTRSLYRPFTRQWLYYSRTVNERVYQMPRIFPLAVAEAGNRVIMVKQRQHDGSQFALMTDHIPELQTDGGTQCFPEYLYESDASVTERARIFFN